MTFYNKFETVKISSTCIIASDLMTVSTGPYILYTAAIDGGDMVAAGKCDFCDNIYPPLSQVSTD